MQWINSSCIPSFFAKGWRLFHNSAHFSKNAHGNSVTNFSSVRYFVTTKNLCSCTTSSSTTLFPHLRLLFRTFTKMYMYFWIGWCPSVQQSGLSLLLFCVPLYNVLSFLVHCCLCVWNQHCLGWKIFCTYSRFPEANVSERQISRVVRTIRDTRFVCVYTQDSLSRTISEVNTSFFHGPHLRVSRTPQVFRVTRRILSHRHAVSRNETTCACFHLKEN